MRLGQSFSILFACLCRCGNITSFEMPVCEGGGNTTMVAPQAILEHYGVELPIYCYVSAIVIELFLWRTVAYFALKYKKKPH